MEPPPDGYVSKAVLLNPKCTEETNNILIFNSDL